MSRVKRFAHSLASGYLLQVVNMLYTLASVPLALHYLTRAEFGLWAVTTQIAGYITLIDAGMTNAAVRILIDHKDDRAGGAYGGVIKTSLLVGTVQGGLVLLIGTLLALAGGALLHVPMDLRKSFTGLLLGLSLLTGISFTLRSFANVPAAHQRFDISNFAQIVLFGLALPGMWLGFAFGLGVFALLVAQATLVLGAALINVTACVWLKLLPGRGQWGRASWAQFKELFAFGRDVFAMGVGWQFINTSQTILLTRFLGLDVAAVWSVCTRTYNALTVLVWRILDYAEPALAEMMVRGERDRLLRRFREVAVLVASLAVLAGTLFAVCNGPFVQLWTNGKIHWSPVNNLLLAAWFCCFTLSRTHSAFAVLTKQFGFLRFVYLVEGLAFIALNLLFLRWGSVTLMLVFSILCTLSFSLPYCWWRTAGYFNVRQRELAGWYGPAWQLAWRLAPVAAAIWWLSRDWPLKWQLAVNAALPGLWGAIALFRYGLSKSLRTDIVERTPLWAKNALKQLGAV
ncbi:MAG: oligosaccharide flippase family protein [Verrucomicrobiia bacterium]